MTHHVHPLRSIPHDRNATTGPKAAGLARLCALGFPVPDGFCIDAGACDTHLASLELTPPAFDQVDRVTLPAFRAAVIEAALDPDLAREISRAADNLGRGPLAVRSSALEEDGANLSFAGQHGTYFIAGRAGCLDAVKHCWASLWSDRAQAYRCRRTGGPAPAMAVVVQRLVAADAAGVAFTADPLTGRNDRVVVESCFGLGEALVSGKVSPDRFVVEASSRRVLDRQIARKTVEVSPGPDGRVYQWAVPVARAAMPSLDDRSLHQVVDLALRAQEIFGHPLDLEWALEGRQVVLLQARPITTLPESDVLRSPVASSGCGTTPPATSAVAADRQPDVAQSAGRALSPGSRPETVWSNVNTGEVLPGVISPMTWSIIERLIDPMISAIFGRLGIRLTDEPLVRLIAGRAYFNASALADAFRAIPALGRVELDEILGGMQRLPDEPGYGDGRAVDRPRQLARALRLLPHVPRALAWFRVHTPSRGLRFARAMRRRTEELMDFDLESASEDFLVARLKEMVQALHTGTECIAYAGVGMAHFTNLRALCARWFPEEGAVLAHRLVTGLGGMDSAEAGLSLWQLAGIARADKDLRADVLAPGTFAQLRERLVSCGEPSRTFLTAWESFVRDHGHHAQSEIDVMVARWSERPDYLLDLVRGSILATEQGADPLGEGRKRAKDRERLIAGCRQQLRNPARRAVFDTLLRQAQQGSLTRENTKSEAVRLLAAIRNVFLAMGRLLKEQGRLAQADDVFFLTLEELTETLRAGPTEGLPATVDHRRDERTRNLVLHPPPVVVGTYDPTSGEELRPTPGGVFRGLGVSPGRAVGRARVIVDTTRGDHVMPGDILVAPFTDPGWTPYFLPASAIVMDMGGLLSHGSIVAREYGIPAVVNVGPATETIVTGQLLEVDGDRGEVRLIAAPE